jgi:pimeloyl-ACP methyl ester carboxylesterase
MRVVRNQCVQFERHFFKVQGTSAGGSGDLSMRTAVGSRHTTTVLLPRVEIASDQDHESGPLLVSRVVGDPTKGGMYTIPRRSDPGPQESWTLAQWGDDVRGFCEALGIAHPIVFGASFGGMVAMAYATPHPDHPAKLILVSTEAAGDTYLERRVALFERFGGPEVGALARRRFLDGHTATATLDTWLRLAFPL